MAINELIAQGVRPIGADLPQIANMLQQRQQTQMQNALMQNQDMRAQADLEMKLRSESDAKKTDDAKRGYAAATRLESLAPEALPGVINSPGFEFIADGLRKQGVDPTKADGAYLKGFVGNLKNATGAYLGIGREAPQFHTIGSNGLLQLNADGTTQVVGASADGTGGKSGFGNVNPGDFTPASLAKYSQSHNFGDLVRNPFAPQVSIVGNVPYAITRGGNGQVGAPQQLVPTQTVADTSGVVAGAKAGAETIAKGQATAKLDLPRLESNAKQTSTAIDEVLKDPASQGVFGMNSYLPIIPGTPRARAQARLDQLKGKIFLEAYNTLKGGGQITEIEGAKASAAMARLEQAQSWKDAREALLEFKGAVNSAVTIGKAKSGGVTQSTTADNVLDFGSLK